MVNKNRHKIRMINRLALPGILWFFFSLSIVSQEVKKIEIINTNILKVNEVDFPDMQILVGSVVLKHDSAMMYCDSAYYNTRENKFTAYGNIKILSPTEDMQDTVYLWGESLEYVGNSRLAMFRKNVVLKKDSMFLYTQDLDYDIAADIGKYETGGRTINGKDTLVSKKGYYYANEDELRFTDKVIIYNPDYTIYSDLLKHHTKKKLSTFSGPTNIVSTDTTSSYLFCENGTYNHDTNIAQFQKNAYLTHEKKLLKGDQLFYDRNLKIAKITENVFMIDSVQKAIITGGYCEYDENTETSTVTKKALFVQIQDNDSLFLHADTLISTKLTKKTDSDTTTYNLVKGFYKVKMFTNDFQSKCDSLVYSTLDSTISLYTKPVLWSGQNQITSDFISIHTKNGEINQIKMFKNSMIASQSDSIRFDQIKGIDMVAHIIDQKLVKVEVFEEGALIYFGKDNERLVAVNKLACKNLVIHLDSNRVDHFWFYEQPDGTLYPPNYLKNEELVFEGFAWFDHFRPKNKEDVFIWTTKPELADPETTKPVNIGKEMPKSIQNTSIPKEQKKPPKSGNNPPKI
jgi:lipopolysaccharide export system protein LptA